VPNVDKTNLVLLLSQCFKDTIDAVSRQAKDRVHIPRPQSFY
jgi:hypothetical protein